MAQSQGGQAVKTSTETLIAAMRMLSQDIQSDDGAANAAVAEAAERLAEQHMRIAQLEQENDAMRADLLLWENGGPLP
jgi:peptidoglycan hydrolase CwlO-like protein